VTAAKATENAARANEQAAIARSEQERLKQLVKWRALSDQAIDTLAAHLSEKKETILLEVVANDPEAMFFGGLLSAAFNKAHWEAVPRSVSWGNFLPLGLHVFGPEGEVLDLLKQSFAAAGVEIDLRPPPREPDWSISFKQGTPTSATVLIGSRIGPF
jgi:hypothetical protein